MISIVLAFLCIATATLSIDHCADSLCRGTRTHIACKNTGAFGEACPNDANIIEFTNELKQLVLDTHNSYRNRIACGEVERYGKAARMATLVWHDELAKFAEYNVRQCVFGHDECRNTEKFLHAGQNLGQMQNNQLFIAPENIIKLLSEGWFSEKAHANMSIIQQYLRTNKKIGHFTQMARDQAYAIGCAMTKAPIRKQVNMRSIIIVGLCIITVTLSIDYCSKSLCRGKRKNAKHIACENDGTFGEECTSNDNTTLIVFTDLLKQVVLNTHNSYRNKIACGNVEGYNKAARMATLVWNNELAKFAEYNVRRCIFEHDKCRNTDKLMYVGQNIARTKNSKKFQAPVKLMKILMGGWFGENKDTNMTVIKKHKRIGKRIGHFTQMVRDQAYLIGCAMIQFELNNWFITIFACNYSLNNILNQPIYDASSEAASECQSGTNEKFKCLCSTSEVYNNKLYYKY
ncbi:allergen Tab y 5.0101-like [Contarinia nasturtii]|uniref:allergen Tab y 5.0101-like n=1 Tax=Contarinia nasturtii TaxID=265458 RepID=UPI0012D412F9|nr:allergen Tab y 5.0101-like [Contarinia nasturtii]